MDAGFWVQVIFNGLVLGSTYVLIAFGLTLVFGIMRLFNFAHGELYMLGAYITYFVVSVLNLSFFIGMGAAIFSMAVLNGLLDRFVFRRLRRRVIHASFMASLAITMMLTTGALVMFGGEARSVGSLFPGVLQMMGASLPRDRLFVIVSCLIFIGLLHFFVQYTTLGLGLRAASQDSEAAQLQGVNVDYSCALAFVIGGALAGAAGAIMSPLFFLSPLMGSPATLKALVVIVVGGLGSIPGAVVGGLALGLIESTSMTFIGGFADMIGWGLVVLLLIFRPWGILGHAE
jgi:branched-chain amino acid transport system permease protein